MGITKSSHLIALGAFDASSGSGGSASAVTLLSITTEPSAPFAKGSKYFNSTDNKIYTAIADDVWGIKGEDPSFVAYYVYNGETYTWDGNSMEPFELENYQKVSNLKTTIEASTTSNNFYPSTSAVANFVFDQGIAHNFSEVKIPNTDPQETLNDYTSSSYTFLDLAQKIQLCQLTMGTILYGEVRNQGMPTGIGNAELRVEVLETKGNGKQVLLFTLFSTNVAPNMWTYIYFQGQTDDAVVWTPRAISTNDYTSTSTGTVPTSKALSDGLATKQDTLTAGENIMIARYPTISSTTKALFNCDTYSNSIANSSITINQNATNGFVSGKFEDAIHINAIDGYSEYGYATVMQTNQTIEMGTQDYHLEFWFRINRSSNGYLVLLGFNNYLFTQVMMQDTGTNYDIKIGGYGVPGEQAYNHHILKSIPKTDTSFHLLTLERTGTTFYFYIDGELLFTKSNLSDSLSDITSEFAIFSHLDIDIDEFLFDIGNSMNHNGQNFTPNVLPYTTASGDALIINTITDNAVSSSSTLPIQSKAVSTALDTLNTMLTTNLTEGLATKQDTLTAGNNIDISIVPGIDSGTQALFHFNDSLTNSITNSSIYADTSASYSYESGKFNNGVRIVTPTSAYGGTYFINSNQNIEVGTQDFYFEFWFKINSLYTREISDYITLLDNSDFGYLLFTNNGTSYTLAVSQYGIPQATTWTYLVATIDYSDTNYHLFTMERTGTNAYIYIDGNLVATRVNATNSIGTISRIMYISGLDISIDEFIFELGNSMNHNGQNFTPYSQQYQDTRTQTVISAIVPTVSTVEVASTTPSLTLADNTFYNCTNALTSLTISSIPANNVYGIEIHFTTDAGFSGVTFPSGTLYTGTLPTWEANKSYLISISRNVVVAAEIKVME